MKTYNAVIKISAPPCQFCKQEIRNGFMIVDGYLFCKNCGYEIPNSKLEVIEGDLIYNRTYAKFDPAIQGYGG